MAKPGLFSQTRQDLACGFGLFTRLPTHWLLPVGLRGTLSPLGRSIWCWPLVGAGVGGVTGLLGWGLEHLLSVAALPAVALALAFQAALTGAFHEDGLADMADSYGAHSRARKLEIMRDSRVGSYGVIALCVCFIVRAGALAALPPAALAPALMLAGGFARSGLLYTVKALPPARPDGLARSLSPLPRVPFVMAQTAMAVLVMLWAAWWPHVATQHGILPLILPLLAACLGQICVTYAAHRQLGGYTGDVLGATACVTEGLVLAALTASFQP
ncbi:adenosylcobinamide-GDP ribazoletransferase [Acetobacter cibinongensis]|uniref:Adenosylcobinamide-GDP ribazoletransferase n=1 Tax=Acetobacter cibinongensis TaxID=146475 RepID=A0A1Z5YTS3_9PROT|nr:adenosylcobinamide-GDP ribazoletransferase [Acetobacter cibinongensis]OUJ01846.1 hypothetical protein HK14_07870 [Acetobacter cibinongensis]